MISMSPDLGIDISGDFVFEVELDFDVHEIDYCI